MPRITGRFDLDLRALQRAVQPFVVLNELAKAEEELPALRLKDRVVEALERAFPSDSPEISALFPESGPFEFHVSVLYPMIEHMRSKDRKYVARTTMGPLRITENGRKVLEEWKSCLGGLDSLLK